MNYYVITGEQNWADEFDVHFFEIINEDDYQKYMAAKEILGTMFDYFGFGSNEGWDGDDEEDGFDYLSFEPKKITEKQYNFLNELGISGESIIGGFYYRLADRCRDAGININVFEAPLDEFKEALKKLESSREEEEED